MNATKTFRRVTGIVTAAAFLFALMAITAANSTVAQTYGSVTLATGFQPDPQTLTGTAGGTVDASVYGTSPTGPCLGSIASTPDNVMYLTTPFSYLSVSVQSDEDTTLVIQGPDGTFCNDDTNGLNPAISRAWSAGAYNIYVGTYSSGQYPSYTIRFTELGGPMQVGQVGPGGLAIGSMTPTFGQVTLGPGFLPDPQTLTGSSGGAVDANQLDAMASGPCRGWVGANPNHLMTLTAPFTYLKLTVQAPGDTTMVINGPNGWMCNDDFGGLNPGFEGPWAAGTYRIWVGSYSSGQAHAYNLSFTEMGGTGQVIPPVTGIQMASMTPTFGMMNLNTGFTPDPQTLAGTSGGAQDANTLGTTAYGPCRGWISEQPDHLLNLGTAFSYLRVDVTSQGDTTLAIYGPNGWMCNDDTQGLNPRIAGPWTPGTYRIWVGSYSSGVATPYNITFTEFQP